jgi:hypothetical protein
VPPRVLPDGVERQRRHAECDAVEDDGGSLAVSAAQRPGKYGGAERKKRHDHQQQGVQQEYEPVGCTDVVEHDVVVGPHLSDKQERDGVGEVGRPEREKAAQQVAVVSRSLGRLISRTSRVMVMAKTASLNATNRVVSRCTDGGSAPALPSGARAIASQGSQRITEKTPPAAEWLVAYAPNGDSIRTRRSARRSSRFTGISADHSE